MKQLSLLSLLLLSLCFLSCTESNTDVDWSEEKMIEILPEIVPVNIFGDPGQVDGMKIRVEGENDWEPYPITFIEGFVFEPGYFYTLKVKITHLANPPLDASDTRFELIELLSKIKDDE